MYTVTGANSGCAARVLSSGACARQVGHHQAWNTTATGLPAVLSASNRAWAKGSSTAEASVAMNSNANDAMGDTSGFIRSPKRGWGIGVDRTSPGGIGSG